MVPPWWQNKIVLFLSVTENCCSVWNYYYNVHSWQVYGIRCQNNNFLRFMAGYISIGEVLLMHFWRFIRKRQNSRVKTSSQNLIDILLWYCKYKYFFIAKNVCKLFLAKRRNTNVTHARVRQNTVFLCWCSVKIVNHWNIVRITSITAGFTKEWVIVA